MSLNINTKFGEIVTSESINEKIKTLIGGNALISGFDVTTKDNKVFVSPGKCCILGASIEEDSDTISLTLDDSLLAEDKIFVILSYIHKEYDFRYKLSGNDTVLDNELIIATMEVNDGVVSKIIDTEKVATLIELNDMDRTISENILGSQHIEYKGNSVTCVETYDSKTEEISIKGESAKTGDIIYSVGSEGNTLKIISNGKNLFNSVVWEDINPIRGTGVFQNGTLTLTSSEDDCHSSTGVITSGILSPQHRKHLIKVMPNKEYIFSFDKLNNSDGYCYYSEYDSDYNCLSFGHSRLNSISFLTSPNCKYIGLRVGISKAGITEVFSNFQIEEGSQATKYESYREHVVEVSLPIEGGLKGLPSGVYDEITKDGDVIQRVGRVIFNGSENWKLLRNDHTIIFTLPLDETASNANQEVLCDRLPSVGFNQNIENIYCDNKMVYLVLNKGTVNGDNLEGFKAWLGRNNLEMLFEIDHTGAVRVENINMHTFNGVTYIESQSSLKPVISCNNQEGESIVINDSEEGITTDMKLLGKSIGGRDSENIITDGIELPIFEGVTHVVNDNKIGGEFNFKLFDTDISGEGRESLESNSNSKTKGLKVEGKTLVNLYSGPKQIPHRLTQGMHFTSVTIANVDMFKLNQVYTFIYKIKFKENTTSTQVGEFSTQIGISDKYDDTETHPDTLYNSYAVRKIGTYNVFRMAFTDFKGKKYLTMRPIAPDVRPLRENEVVDYVVSDFIIIEGDYLNNPVSYFNGIESLGEEENKISLLSHRKNLFNINDDVALFSGCTYTKDESKLSVTSTTDTGYCQVSFKHILKRNTDYILSANTEANNSNGEAVIRVIGQNGSKVDVSSQSGGTGSGKKEIRFNTSNNTDFRVYFYGSINPGKNGGKSTYSDIYLYEATESAKYENFSGMRKDITLPYEHGLKSLPNGVCDELLSDGTFIQRIGSITLDGTIAPSALSKTKEKTLLFTFNNVLESNKKPVVLQNNTNIVCDRFIPAYNYNDDQDMAGTFINTTTSTWNSIYFGIDKTSLSAQSIDGFKAWLSQNPTTVYYELETPIIHKPTNETVTITGTNLPAEFSHYKNIVSAGEEENGSISLVSHGKNLCPDNFELGKFDEQGLKVPNDSSIYKRTVSKISLKSNSSYSIQFTGEDRRLGVYIYDANEKFTRVLYDSQALNFTTSKNEVFANIRLANESTNIQLENNKISTQYQEYRDEVKQVKLLANGLKSLSSGVKDEVMENGILNKNVEKVIFNGTENWAFNTSNGDFRIFHLDLNKATAGYSQLTLCDRFPSLGFERNKENIYVDNKRIFIVINKSKLQSDDLEGFKAWLVSNNTTVLFAYDKKETPRTENYNLHTFDGVTYVSQKNTIPGDIAAKALSSTGELIEDNGSKYMQFNDSVSNITKDLIVEGRTLNNIRKSNEVFQFQTNATEDTFTVAIKNNEGIDVDLISELGDSYGYFHGGSIKPYFHMLKPNTTYTVICESNGIQDIRLMTQFATETLVESFSKINNTTFIFTTKSTLSFGNQVLYANVQKNITGRVYFRKPMILEGDYSDKNISSDYFEGISSSGENENQISVLSNSRNLFNPDDIAAFSTQHKLVRHEGVRCIKLFYPHYWHLNFKYRPVKFKENTSYILRFKLYYEADKVGHYFVVYYTDGTYFTVSKFEFNKWFECVYKTPADKTIDYVGITYAFGDAAEATYIDLDSILLAEDDSSVTEYIPYESDIKNINLPFSGGLKSLPDGTCDEILSNGTIIRRVEKATFNGTENWVFDSDNGDLKIFYLDFNKATDDYNQEVICNRLPSYGFERNKENIYIDNKRIFAVINKTKLSTNDLDGFKNFISSNNLEVVFKYDNNESPRRENYNIRTFDGTTYISQDNKVTGEIAARVLDSNNVTVEKNGFENIEFSNTLNGSTDSLTIKERTYQNLKTQHAAIKFHTGASQDTYEVVSSDIENAEVNILSKLNGNYGYFHGGTVSPYFKMLKPNTTYTVLCESKGVTHIRLMTQYSSKPLDTGSTKINDNMFIFTTNSTLTLENQIFFARVSESVTGNVYLRNPIILEGNYSDKHIPSGYFREISSVGEIENKVTITSSTSAYTGELFAGFVAATGIINKFSDEGTNKEKYTNRIKVKPNTEYFIRYKSSRRDGNNNNAWIGIGLYDSKNNFITRYTPNEVEFEEYMEYKFRTTSSTDNIIISGRHLSYDSNIQVSDSGKFIEFRGDRRDIVLPFSNGLKSLPSGVCDEIRGDGSIIQKVSKIVLDGSENWKPYDLNGSLNANKDNLACYFVTIDDIKLGYNENGIFSNKFSYCLRAWDLGKEFTFSDHPTHKRVYFNVPKSTASNLDDFKSWLRNNNITVYYELENPVTTIN